jgi:hypothetical protein
MKRINFFQLLNLRINPPENDLAVIEAAIKNKQAEWSRFRNHPTKGIQARQYIGLLAEVRRVMLDPKLRSKEASDANEELKRRYEAKVARLDAHIRLLAAKGTITDQDIRKLAGIHRLKESIVQKRAKALGSKRRPEIEQHLIDWMTSREIDEKQIPTIAKKLKADPDDLQEIYHRIKTSRLKDIDNYIAIQLRKGYMTQTEISDLATFFGIAESEVFRRVRVPVKKTGDDKGFSEKRLDRTVEKVIEENLAVVGHSSLYSFLDLWPSSSLEAIQKTATAKETDIRKIAHKDARVTASGILAGHCLSIFKNDESRYAYDLSRARSLLNAMGSDIDLVASSDGKIDKKSYQYLVQNAIAVGTPPSQAKNHILDYCRTKNWSVDLPKFKHKKDIRSIYLGFSIGAVLVSLTIGIIWWRDYKQDLANKAYQELTRQLAAEPLNEKKEQMLLAYIDSNPEDILATKAKFELINLRREIVNRDYQQMASESSLAMDAKQFETVEQLYRQFLSSHPDAPQADDINAKLSELPDLIDNRDFDSLVAMDPEENISAAVAAGETYLKRHPEGNHADQVTTILDGLVDDFYTHTRQELTTFEAESNWQACILAANRFINLYRDNPKALTLRTLRDGYQINLENDRIIAALREKAKSVGGDPKAVEKIFSDYLKDNPRTPARQRIAEEIEKMAGSVQEVEVSAATATVRRRLQAAKGGYFSEKASETLTDSRTGHAWTMVDSAVSKGRCLNYDEARQYVKALSVGGYKDWRLPSSPELENLLSQKAAFPGEIKGEWLWTSENYRRYSGGWVTEVNAIQLEGENRKAVRTKKDSRSCGSVVAVRR